MAHLRKRVPSTGSELSAILQRNPEFIRKLCLCLDGDMKFIRSWRHLASILHVDLDVIRRLGQYGDISPTIRLFDYLATSKPVLTIKELKDILLKIGRNDLISLLVTKAGCADNEKVIDVITSPSNEVPSPEVGLLDKIALALDGTSLVVSNWYTLALNLGVPRKTCWNFERRSTENPTARMFQYLVTSYPKKTLLSLREALDSINRKDLIKFLHEEKLRDDVFLKDIITPGSELLERLALELNREDNPVVKNWTHLAWKMNLPADVCRALADVKQIRNSPTKEVLEWVAAKFPETALSDIAKALDGIQRNDAIQIISEHFPDTVDLALQGLGCSFKDSSSMPDPNQMFSISFEREAQDSFPNIEVKEQSGHYGNLPDRIDLVGRNETCERIITALSSNKAVEIVASPGYGKTSVVIEVAHRMIERKTCVAYVKPRGVTCVEDLASTIIETLGYVPGENTITEVLSCISSLRRKSVVLIIENIDNLLHLEDKVSKDKYHQAREILTQANDIHSTLTNVKETTRAQCMSKFGFCYVREGRVDEGYGYLDIALKLRWDREEKLKRNKDHVMLAACFNDIAASQMVQRNHMMAIQTWLLHVLPVYEEKLGDHPFTATTLSWIGNSYHALGDYENAINYSSRSISIRRQLLGQHQETAKSLYDVGVAYSAKQDYETALEYLKEAVDYQEKVLDTQDELIHSHQAMSIALRALGRDEEAEEEMNRAGECTRKLDSWEATQRKTHEYSCTKCHRKRKEKKLTCVNS